MLRDEIKKIMQNKTNNNKRNIRTRFHTKTKSHDTFQLLKNLCGLYGVERENKKEKQNATWASLSLHHEHMPNHQKDLVVTVQIQLLTVFWSHKKRSTRYQRITTSFHKLICSLHESTKLLCPSFSISRIVCFSNLIL